MKTLKSVVNKISQAIAIVTGLLLVGVSDFESFTPIIIMMCIFFGSVAVCYLLEDKSDM